MAEHFFKSIYFPREKCASRKSTRVTLSFPCELAEIGHAAADFRAFVSNLSSRQFRMAIGDPILEHAEAAAQKEMRSFSNHCLMVLKDLYLSHGADSRWETILPSQLSLAIDGFEREEETSRERGVTFKENQHRNVYNWYPYVEGFAAGYVRDTILRSSPVPRTVYDPFGGSGTTQLAASLLGIRSFYSEVNPFMGFVAETKVNCSAWARNNLDRVSRIFDQFRKHMNRETLDRIGSTLDREIIRFNDSFPQRDFFEETHLRHLLAAKHIVLDLTDSQPHLRDILLLACAANVVSSSHMTRRADLRRRRDDEYKTRVVDVPQALAQTADKMLQDILNLPLETAAAVKVSEDCRAIPAQYLNAFDVAITSPPYLNGTNYFRNTKLELWFMNFISTEAELTTFHKRSIVAGINAVSKAHPLPNRYDQVEEIAQQLEQVAPDKRIPALVRQYVSDMHDVCAAVHRALVPGGRLYLDIGDSRFYGVHVPTDHFLEDIANKVGFSVEHKHLLAKRYSRDKSDLVQVELVMRKKEQSLSVQVPSVSADLGEKISSFALELPYKRPPFNSRSWGHPLHSLCSYQGKLKPSLAHWVIETFVGQTGSVLDPLGGVGTVAFEAALSGRHGVSNDKSPFAATIAAAKLDPPRLEEALQATSRMRELLHDVQLDHSDFNSADFGLNKSIKDYYHPDTLVELLKAKKLFNRYLASPKKKRAETFLWASLLHVLHGNRPYALSRESHPIVPLSPKGPFVYKSVVEHIERRIILALKSPLPERFSAGIGINGDFRTLEPSTLGQFDCILTSPPFMGMRFDRPNWIRLWFCGWEQQDFHERSLGFLEREQTKSKLVYRDFFTMCERMLNKNGLVILHVGDDERDGLVDSLRTLGKEKLTFHGDIIEDVQSIEQHGLSDKGNRTLRHHLLIFQNG